MVMGLALWGLEYLLAPWLSADYWRYLALLVLIFAGMAIYGLAGQALGAFRISEFRGAFRRSAR